ncbi:MAG: LacI family DNA-binding transcriptional regulator [Chloroflexota bacterium]
MRSTDSCHWNVSVIVRHHPLHVNGWVQPRPPMIVAAGGRRVTSADVARQAGVSRTTVSYVLNDTAHQKIPESTRQRVLEAAARLAYAPSAAARALRNGRTDIVLCLLPDWPIGPTIGAFLEHLSTALASEGLMLVVHPRSGGARHIAEVWKAVTPAAVIAFEDFPRDEAAAMRAAGVEVVTALLGRSSRGREFGIPQQRSGCLQVEHLAATGHRRLGYAFPADERVHSFARPRLDGVRQACADLGLDQPVVHTVPLDPEAAAGAVRAWRAAKPTVTGVCAFNDDTAFAVLAGLRWLGLSSPRDLAVVGVDDIPAAAFATPPLTTVTTDMAAVAAQLARTITSSVTGKARPGRPDMRSIVHLVRRCSA